MRHGSELDEEKVLENYRNYEYRTFVYPQNVSELKDG